VWLSPREKRLGGGLRITDSGGRGKEGEEWVVLVGVIWMGGGLSYFVLAEGGDISCII